MPDKPPNNEGAHFDAFRVNSHLTGNSNAQWLLGAMAATQVGQRELVWRGKRAWRKRSPARPPPLHFECSSARGALCDESQLLQILN